MSRPGSVREAVQAAIREWREVAPGGRKPLAVAVEDAVVAHLSESEAL